MENQENNNSNDLQMEGNSKKKIEINNQNNHQNVGANTQLKGKYSNYQNIGVNTQSKVRYNNQQTQNNNQYNVNNTRSNRNNKKIILLSSVVLVVLIVIATVFMFFSNRNEVGASSPEAAVKGYVDAIKKDDYVKANNYFYYENSELRNQKENQIKETLKEDNGVLTKSRAAEKVKKSKVLEVKEQTDTEAKVIVSIDGGEKVTVPTIKIEGKWYMGYMYPY